MTVQITVDIPAGRIEATREILHGLTQDGTEGLAETLRNAGNAILRSYGLQPELIVSRTHQRLIEEGKKATPRGGW